LTSSKAKRVLNRELLGGVIYVRNVTYAGVGIYALPWAQASSSMRRASSMCAVSSMSDDQEKAISVIARSAATKQSSAAPQRWIASLRSQ